jgi:hypothetical protein
LLIFQDVAVFPPCLRTTEPEELAIDLGTLPFRARTFARCRFSWFLGTPSSPSSRRLTSFRSALERRPHVCSALLTLVVALARKRAREALARKRMVPGARKDVEGRCSTSKLDLYGALQEGPTTIAQSFGRFWNKIYVTQVGVLD